MLVKRQKILIIKPTSHREHAMTTYFILDRTSNTWSDAHYPLSSILATPGITEGDILANARTRQTLTVAQARSLTQAGRRPAVTTRVAKPTANKTLTIGMTMKRDTTRTKGGSFMSFSDIPKQSDRKYKVISQSDSVFSGQFNARKLNQVLNQHAQQGWRLVNCATATVCDDAGNERQEFMAVLEKTTV